MLFWLNLRVRPIGRGMKNDRFDSLRKLLFKQTNASQSLAQRFGFYDGFGFTLLAFKLSCRNAFMPGTTIQFPNGQYFDVTGQRN